MSAPTENLLPTTDQKRWWNKFCQLMRAMPEDMEVVVNAYGGAYVAPRGAVLKALNGGGDAGDARTIILPTLNGCGLVDGSGGL